MDIPQGYKQTELGVIPEDWENKTIGDLVSFSGGSQPPRSTFIFEHKEGYIRLIQIRDYKTDEFKTYIPENLARKRCSIDDIMIGRYGPPIFQILQGIEGAYNVALIKATPIGNVSKNYLYYFLKQESLLKFVEGLSQRSSGQTGIEMDALKDYPFPIPSDIEEQKAIAQSLSDVDALITAIDKLITKKRNIKQGTMQQLLTGKKRLPGFGEGYSYKQTEIGKIPEDWNVLQIAEIVESNRIPSGIYKEKSLYGNGTKIIKLSDVFSLDYFDPAKAKRVVLNRNELLMYRVSVGDIFIALASVKLEGVGKVMLVTELDEDTAYDHNVALIRTNELVEAKFIFYLLKSDLVRREVSKLSTQVGTTFLKSSSILKFKIPIPAFKAEQAFIATVLSEIDAEIEKLEKKREKYKLIKQGMMQELLTGKTRLNHKLDN
jgi:type I restriction enzyme, S subunit